MAIPPDEKVIQKIQEGQSYDAYTMIAALSNRLAKKKQYEESIDLCARMGSKFIEVNQHSLAYALGNLIINILREYNLPFDEGVTQTILKLFDSKPREYLEERFQYIENAIKLAEQKGSTNVSNKKLLKKLHDTAAYAYAHACEYGLSQHHFYKSRNVSGMIQLLNQWKAKVYPSEKELIVLRLILGLLLQGDTSLAFEVLNAKSLKYSLDDQHTPPAIQCAYMLCESCKSRSAELLQLTTRKYHLILRKDPAFKGIIQSIEERYFNISRPQPFNLNTLMSQMLAV